MKMILLLNFKFTYQRGFSTFKQNDTILEKPKRLYINKILTNNTSLTIQNSTRFSSVGLIINKEIRNNTIPPKEIFDIFIGLLLGDGHLTISFTSNNASFVFV